MVADQSPPLQLRLGFTHPSRPMTMALALSGLTVIADSPDAHIDVVCAHLSSLGVPVTDTDSIGASFPVSALSHLVELPASVQVVTDMDLEPLWSLLHHPSDAELPATLDVEGSDLRLCWSDGVDDFDLLVPSSSVPALIASEVSFVATPVAWEFVRQASTLPLRAGRARMNMDGFVEVSSTRPQLVESAQLPALFRIDDTHFGLPASFASHVAAHPGFSWEGPPPSPMFEQANVASADRFGVEPGELARFARHLGERSAAVLVGDRRDLALCAVDAFDELPVLVVAAPEALWGYAHLCSSAGRRHAHMAPADVVTATYDELGSVPLDDVASVIFDDPFRSGVPSAAALRRLESLSGVLRVAVCPSWSLTDAAAPAVLAAVRPVEFRADVAVHQRYGTDAEKRFAAHADVYRFDSAGRSAARRRVVRVETPEAIVTAAAALEAHPPVDPLDLFAGLEELGSAGPPHVMSPKLSVLHRLVGDARAEGRRVFVATRHERAAKLAVALLRPFGARRSAAPDAGSAAVVVCPWPLPAAPSPDDVVVLVDYPRSLAEADALLGAALTFVVHTSPGVDDLAALLALRGAGSDSVSTAEALASRVRPSSPRPSSGPPRPMVGHSVAGRGVGNR